MSRTRINLLPWRELEHKQRLREFGFILVGAVILALLAGVYAHTYMQGLIKNQNDRNAYLDREIKVIDEKIIEIKELEKTKARLLARMEIIQQLQVSRPQIVHLFDELVETLPEGSFLTAVEQAANSLVMKGRAQSNARVSSYMRNIEDSKWLDRPALQLIENKEQTQTGMSYFELKAQQVTATAEEGKAQ